MAKESTERGHVCAWVLVTVASGHDPKHSKKVAKAIYALNDGKLEGACVVRADTVTGHESYDIVVPVYARNDDALKDAVDKIQQVPGVADILRLTVDKHWPEKPKDPCGELVPEGQNAWG